MPSLLPNVLSASFFDPSVHHESSTTLGEPLPSAFTTNWLPNGTSASSKNAMRLPSGDQTGSDQSPTEGLEDPPMQQSPWKRRVASEPSAPITQTSNERSRVEPDSWGVRT